MKSRIVVEIGLLGCAILLAWGAAFFALRGGMLSAQNTREAIAEGAIGYAICRILSVIPLATHWTGHAKFFVCASVGSFIFYFYIIWTNARA